MYADGVPQGFAADDASTRRRRSRARGDRRDDDRRDLRDLPPSRSTPTRRATSTTPSRCAREGDGYRAWVHIADVSLLRRRPTAPIDAEARRRTASVYLPLWAEPMLPPELSSGVCSLKPRASRASASRSSSPSTPPAAGRRVCVLPLADPQRPPPDLRVRRRGARPGDGRAVPRADRGARRRAPALAPTALAGRPAAGAGAGQTLRARALRARRPADRLVRARVSASTPAASSSAPTQRLESAVAQPRRGVHAGRQRGRRASSSSARHARALYRVHEPPRRRRPRRCSTRWRSSSVPTPPFPASRDGDRGARSRAPCDGSPRRCRR